MKGGECFGCLYSLDGGENLNEPRRDETIKEQRKIEDIQRPLAFSTLILKERINDYL